VIDTDLGLCRRCENAAVATVKGTDEPLCFGHIMEARKSGEFSVVLAGLPDRKPRFSVPKLKEAIQACDFNIQQAKDWIVTEEARKVEYWGLIEEIEQEA